MSTVDASGAIHGTDGKFAGHVAGEADSSVALGTAAPVVWGQPQNAEQMDVGDELAAQVEDANLAMQKFGFPQNSPLSKEAHGTAWRSIRHELSARYPGSDAVVLEYDDDSRDWSVQQVLDGTGQPMPLDEDGNNRFDQVDGGELTDRLWTAQTMLAINARGGSVTRTYEQIDEGWPPRSPEQAADDLNAAIDWQVDDIQRSAAELRTELEKRRNTGESA